MATALSRMSLYISKYGLTLDRIHASWFMIVLASAFVLAILKQVWSRLPFTAILIGCTAVLFAVLIYGNANAMVANYNADAYLDGRLESVDVSEIYDMEYAGVPALIRLAQNAPDADVAESAQKYLDQTRRKMDSAENRIWSFNFPAAKARRLISK